MRELINNNGKMTSLVIAEITGKNHSDIMRAIRKMEESWLKIGQSNFALTSPKGLSDKEVAKIRAKRKMKMLRK